MQAFLVAFGVIFVAELGDKSQLMALAFAARFKAVQVLVGIAVATALVHAVSVGIGAFMGVELPTRAVDLIAGVAFLGFAAWTLRGDELSEDEATKVARSDRSAVVGASVAFFLAELGDKTMLATITLATNHGLLGTWAGSTAGMVVADALAMGVGRVLGTRLPERAIRVGAAGLFVIFGLLLVANGVRG